jgi:hypothetical protein
VSKISSLSSFLKENAEKASNFKIAISPRFKNEDGTPAEWELKPLSIPEVERTKAKYTTINLANSRKSTENSKILKEIIVGSVISPNLKSEELQKSYGAIGDAMLLDKMLTYGEYARLTQAVSKAMGFDETMKSLVDTAKN